MSDSNCCCHYDIFLSYSRKDYERLGHLLRNLESYGISVWYDTSNINYTNNFPDKIAEALDRSDSVLFICTDNSLKSAYCKKEIGYARSQNKKIRAVLLDGFMPKTGWFALEYQDINCADYTDPHQIQLLYQELCDLSYKKTHPEQFVNNSFEGSRTQAPPADNYKQLGYQEISAKAGTLIAIHFEDPSFNYKKPLIITFVSLALCISSIVLLEFDSLDYHSLEVITLIIAILTGISAYIMLLTLLLSLFLKYNRVEYSDCRPGFRRVVFNKKMGLIESKKLGSIFMSYCVPCWYKRIIILKEIDCALLVTPYDLYGVYSFNIKRLVIPPKYKSIILKDNGGYLFECIGTNGESVFYDL